MALACSIAEITDSWVAPKDANICLMLDKLRLSFPVTEFFNLINNPQILKYSFK